MDILVFSDSHGRISGMREAIAAQVRRPDAVLFLGDGLRDADRLEEENPDIPFYKVRGNCDMYSAFEHTDAPDERFIELGGIKIFMTHGHLFSVKGGYGRLCTVAGQLGAELVLFGHTHQPISEYIVYDGKDGMSEKTKGFRLFNPGSIGYGGTWGTVTVTSDREIITGHGEL